jgi:hypothetical protein
MGLAGGRRDRDDRDGASARAASALIRAAYASSTPSLVALNATYLASIM